MDLRPWQRHISHFLISQVEIELTEVILLRVIDQLQNLIRGSEASEWLLRTGGGRQCIDLNDINELEVISQRTLAVIINQVLPFSTDIPTQSGCNLAEEPDETMKAFSQTAKDSRNYFGYKLACHYRSILPYHLAIPLRILTNRQRKSV